MPAPLDWLPDLGIAAPTAGTTPYGFLVARAFAAVNACNGVSDGSVTITAAEQPSGVSSSLFVRVAAALARRPDGSRFSHPGSASLAVAASATNYIFLDQGGVLTANTTGFPVWSIPLATVTTDSTHVLLPIVDERTYLQPTDPPPLKTVTAAYVVAGIDAVILADTTAGAFTVTLPDPTTQRVGKPYRIKQISSNNVLTIATAAGTIDGAATKVYAARDEAHDFVSDGTNWWVIPVERRPIKTVTAAYTASIDDERILANTTSGAFTVTLPTAATLRGKEYSIKQITSANVLTVGSAGGTIDGAATKVYAAQNESHRFASDGTNWWIF